MDFLEQMAQRKKDYIADDEEFKANRPDREKLREQVFGAVMMGEVHVGSQPASSWLDVVRKSAPSNKRFVFEPGYLVADGYVETTDAEGNTVWSLPSSSKK